MTDADVVLVSMGVLALMCAARPAVADPCTLYKPEHIAIARENIEKHEWAADILAGYRSSVAHVMGVDEQFIHDMVPALTPGVSYGHVCPNCLDDKCSPGETGVFKWTVSDPEHIKCKYCGTVYPNDEYPETGTITAPAAGQTFTYYQTPEERAHPDDDSGKYAYRWASWPIHVSWSGLIRYQKAAWVYGQVTRLAKVYALTGEVEYAEHCAWVLDRIASS